MTSSEVGELPQSLRANPRLGDWLTSCPTGIVEVRSGKVDIGQGVLTALAQIVAEELDVNIARVRVIAATTGTSPNEGYTAGSLSVQHSGSALRLVGAETRSIYLRVAAAAMGVARTFAERARRQHRRARRPKHELLGARGRHAVGPSRHRMR